MKNSDIKIIFMGTPDFSVSILEALIHEGYKIVSVVTKSDELVGRKQLLTSPSVKILAQKFGILILQPETLKDKNFTNHIKNLAPDLIVVAAYGKIISKVILDIPRFGTINVHGSLLPVWRGASPIQYAILNGDKETGITIILVDEEIDHGKIISNAKIKVLNNYTYKSLSKKLSNLGAELLIRTIPDYISGKIKPVAQDHLKATYTKIIKKDDGQINWSKSAVEIERTVRAFYPWPTVWTTWNNKLLKMIEADVMEISNELKIGEVFTSGLGLAIKCGQNALHVKKLQLEGGKIMTAQEFLNGHKNFISSVLS